MLQIMVPQIIQKIVYKIDPIHTIPHAYLFLKNKKKREKITHGQLPSGGGQLERVLHAGQLPRDRELLELPGQQLAEVGRRHVHYRVSCWPTRRACFASGHVCSRSLGCLFPAQEPKEEKGKTRGATKLQIQITSSNHNNSKQNSSYKCVTLRINRSKKKVCQKIEYSS